MHRAYFMPHGLNRLAWPIALGGLGLLVFALVALSGPGRIDRLDGQTRYEVGRSLVKHRDSIVRDPRITWNRFPGRDGFEHADAPLPPSVVAAGAILIADATGPVSEGRRHFFFVLGGAVACGLLVILYALWFRSQGIRPSAALLWAFGGIVCTPVWFYGTSTLDEGLGSVVLVAALVTASLGSGKLLGAIAAGLLLGLAYSCNPVLAVFCLLGLALNDDRSAPFARRFMHATFLISGLLAGVLAEIAYDRIKFPYGRVDSQITHRSLDLDVGMFLYCPSLALFIVGIVARWRNDRRLVLALIAGSIAFVGFAATAPLSEPSWGPRRMTPLFAVLWMFTFLNVGHVFQRTLATLVLGLAVIVQLLALSVDSHRLAVEREQTGSHLFQRPREILEIARADSAEEFTPAPSPTFAFPIDPPYLEKKGPEVVKRYQVLNGFRPWWVNQRFLPPDERPVNLAKTLAILLGLAGLGCVMLGLGWRCLRVPR